MHRTGTAQDDTEQGRYKLPALLALSEVAASLSTDTDIETLLGRYLSTMIRIAGAAAGTVRLLTADGAHLRLAAAVGLPAEVLERERVVPLACGVCGDAVSRDSEVCSRALERCAEVTGHAFFRGCEEVYAVPLRHAGATAGVFNLFLRRAGALPEEVRALFGAIGEHLGMALENARLTRENTRITLVNERQMLANQVHDSLAQTLAYARMRAGALRRAQTEGNAALAERYQSELESALDGAYGELRGLIGQFREPMDPRGLSAAVRDALAAFSARTGLQVDFEDRALEPGLTPEEELQVFHVIQEALANVERHAGARQVRVVIDRAMGRHSVLIEDDGAGFDPAQSAAPGHFGLSIMRERAAKLRGELAIERRPTGGTRVALSFPDRT
ncbi:MAG: GAF domain-containing protein [Betaproteobacteria bacterium]|nr:GAF domain-containing protein [Betaproteobacteria bacterium]